MTRHPLRSAVAFVIALAALTAGAYALQQTIYAPPAVLDLTPVADAPPAPPVPASRPVAPATPAEGTDVPVVEEAWLARVSTASGVPLVALRAYARAELMAPDDCGLGWTTLAGIGWIESQHGTIGGRTVGEDGVPDEPVLGPALDGEGGFKAIPATPDSTRWHGDPDWDHAMGPMQFIPGTWETWATDGDGDGTSDPHDLDDAALAAARYLCAGGRDLTGATDWTAAVLSYNASREYLDSVHAAASSYADRTS